MANISIGEPPSPQLLIMDTGSSLSWTQCQPCTHCFPQAVPIFTHSMSSTYSVVSCNNPQCLQAPSDNYEPSGCSFKQNYVESTTVSRSLGTDKLTFDTSD
ncbi:hypothetical protein ACJW30_06G022200 [Castanea mollissima]